MSNQVLAMIPARLDSVRLKNKLMLEVQNKPVICHTVDRVLLSKEVGRVCVCCADQEIADYLEEYYEYEEDVVVKYNNYIVETGCDRTSLTLLHNMNLLEGLNRDIVLHVHGDEASINPESLTRLVRYHKLKMPSPIMVQLLSRSIERDEHTRNSCKVAVDWDGTIEGYSRDRSHFFTAIGAFSFSAIGLVSFHKIIPGPEETKTNIEQYRFMELGLDIKGFDAGLGDVKSAIDHQSDLDRLKSLVQEWK